MESEGSNSGMQYTLTVTIFFDIPFVFFHMLVLKCCEILFSCNKGISNTILFSVSLALQSHSVSNGK